MNAASSLAQHLTGQAITFSGALNSVSVGGDDMQHNNIQYIHTFIMDAACRG